MAFQLDCEQPFLHLATAQEERRQAKHLASCVPQARAHRQCAAEQSCCQGLPPAPVKAASAVCGIFSSGALCSGAPVPPVDCTSSPGAHKV